MKYFYIIAFLLISSTQTMAETVNHFEVKKLTSCFDFVDLYAKVIENTEDPTIEDKQQFDLAVERVMGYITGIEAGTRTRIFMKEHGITELSILEDVNKACLVAPNISLDQAVLSLSMVNAAIMNANSRVAAPNYQSCQQFCDE